MPVHIEERVDRRWRRLRSFASREAATLFAIHYSLNNNKRVRAKEVGHVHRVIPQDIQLIDETILALSDPERPAGDLTPLVEHVLHMVEPYN